MISRSRSAPTAAAMSIECTTSANSTVTCLYSADGVARVSRVPHSLQNLAVGPDCAPQEPQNSPVAVSAPRLSPAPSTSVSFHRCSADVRHIAVALATRSFETFICRRLRHVSARAKLLRQSVGAGACGIGMNKCRREFGNCVGEGVLGFVGDAVGVGKAGGGVDVEFS